MDRFRYLASAETLLSLESSLYAEFGLRARCAFELEWYQLPALSDDDFSALFVKLDALPLHHLERERGEGQLELALHPDTPATAVSYLLAAKTSLAEFGDPDFRARPFTDQPGSGLHLHVHLEDEQQNNVFYKDDERISDPLRYAIGGLLRAMPASMPVFAPNADDYARFTIAPHTPTTVSWGANNRTTSIRLPDKPHADKHIEHRVACPSADTLSVVVVVLASILDGLRNHIHTPAQIYGDASRADYGCEPLPTSLADAMAAWEQNLLIRGLFQSA